MFYSSTKTYEVLGMKDTPNTYDEVEERYDIVVMLFPF